MMFNCPQCEGSFKYYDKKCTDCGWTVPRQHGILSLINSPGKKTEFESVLKYHNELPLEQAISSSDIDFSHREDMVEELFSFGRENWRLLISEAIGGDCLELYCRTGRRTRVLAENCQRVVAIDPSLDQVRLASMRTEPESGTIIPVHGSTESVPLLNESFDLFVSDLSSATEDISLLSIVDIAETVLSEEGTAVILFDGFQQETEDWYNATRQYLNKTSIIRNELADRSFSIEQIVLYPGIIGPDFCFPKNDNSAENWFINQRLKPNSIPEKLLYFIAVTAQNLGVMKYFYPGYGIVLSKSGNLDESPSDENSTYTFPDGMALRGRYRSTLFEFDENLKRVHKVPNVRKYEEFNQNEAEIIEYIKQTNQNIRESLPETTSKETKFGTVQVEAAAEGTQLLNQFDRSFVSFKRTLTAGFDWLIELQTPYQSEQIVYTPEDLGESLAYDPLDIQFEPPSSSFSGFQSPVHGDFNQVNCFVDEDGITTVIDWEYGDIGGNPYIDSTNFLLTLIDRSFKDFSTGIEEAFINSSKYKFIVESEIDRYCAAVNLPIDAFYDLLPLGLLYRMDITDNYHTKLSLVTLKNDWKNKCQILSRFLSRRQNQI